MNNTHDDSPSAGAQIQGVYEACIGVDELEAQIQYWSNFGYEVADLGQLDAQTALQLYAVDSALESVRLKHMEADHGLIRLMKWDQPTGPGFGLSPMRTQGGRWTASMTEDVMTVMNHIEVAQEQGLALSYVPPQWAVIYQPSEGLSPFHDPLVGVREMFLCHPLTRQILFQRFNYKIENYGQINPYSLFKSSQVTHFGLLFQSDDPSIIRFYDEVLGLLLIREVEDTYEGSKAGRAIFDLEPNDRYFFADFDDPRSSATDYTKARSGRLKILRWASHLPLHQSEPARPGALGLTLYTYRVSEIEIYHRRVSGSRATQVTDIILDEFGARAFSFVSPDGYDWTLIEDPHIT